MDFSYLSSVYSLNATGIHLNFRLYNKYIKCAKCREMSISNFSLVAEDILKYIKKTEYLSWCQMHCTLWLSLVFAGGAGSLLPPGSGRRHAHTDGRRLGEPRAERGGHDCAGVGLHGARTGGRQAGGQRTAFLQREERHPDVSRGSAQCSQHCHPAVTLKPNIRKQAFTFRRIPGNSIEHFIEIKMIRLIS